MTAVWSFANHRQVRQVDERHNSSDGTIHALKLTQIGNSVGVILPKEVLARLKLMKGDSLFITDTPDGMTLTPYDPSFEIQMTAARAIMHKRRNVLHELAK